MSRGDVGQLHLASSGSRMLGESPGLYENLFRAMPIQIGLESGILKAQNLSYIDDFYSLEPKKISQDSKQYDTNLWQTTV